jgi:RNA polymerase sigma factor (sigma-70 family)
LSKARRRQLERLFDEHADWAAAIARNVARRVPASIYPEDLVQEAHRAVWRQLGRWDPARGVPFRGFAFRAVLGAVRMACRRRRWTEATKFDSLSAPASTPGRLQESVAELAAKADLIPDPAESVEAQYIAHEERNRHLAIIRSHMADLHDAEALLIRSVYLEGVDLESLADLWGMEAKRIGVKARAALLKLKRLVNRR